jgi:WD40 repeat protein
LEKMNKASTLISLLALIACTTGCAVFKQSEATSWYLEHELEFQADIMSDVSFSPNGERLITACYDSTAQVWDVASGRKLKVLDGHKSHVDVALFSPDGSMILTASFGQVRVWDVNTYECRLEFRGHRGRFSADSTKIYTEGDMAYHAGPHGSGGGRHVFCWNAETGEKLPGPKYPPRRVVVIGETIEPRLDSGLPDAPVVVTRSRESGLVLVRGQERRTIMCSVKTKAGRAQVSKDASILVINGPEPEQVTAYQVSSGKRLCQFIDTGSDVHLSPDGRLIATFGKGHPGVIFLWDTRTGTRVARLSEHMGSDDYGILALAWSPDSSRIAVVGMTKYPVIWRRGTEHTKGRPIRSPADPDRHMELDVEYE